jgi:phosphoribosylformylglycinamidine synthase
MSYGFDPYLSEQSPFHGAVAAVVESAAKITAAGGKLRNIKLSFQEYFGKPDSPERFGLVAASLLGAFYAQKALSIPAIGGKDSMSGTFKGGDGSMIDVPPTLISFAVCAEKHENIISPEFKRAGSLIGVLRCGADKDDITDISKFIENTRIIERNIENGGIISAYAVGTGGAAAAVSLMAFGNGIGAEIDTDIDLFEEDYGGFVLEMPETIPGESDIKVIGRTVFDEVIRVNGECIGLDDALNSSIRTLDDIFPVEKYHLGNSCKSGNVIFNKNVLQNTKKPLVLIPVFPGANGEIDLEKAFKLAGAETELFIIKNINNQLLNESICKLNERIKSADIIALPGGDINCGTAGAVVLSRPEIAESIDALINGRQGLALGIGAGFHTLLKLGLLPYRGTLAASGARHVPPISNVTITSNISPWFGCVKTGDVYSLPVSYSMTRFIIESGEGGKLAANGQIAARYAGYGSEGYSDIEAITSPDGRILGKMGHSERIGNGLYKNVPGNYDQGIFKAAVKYIKG